MNNKQFVITIGRQYGSGGHDIGRLLATALEVGYYDKELLQKAAQESGLAPEFFERADEVAPRSFMHALSASLSMSGGASSSGECALYSESIFKLQSDVIRGIAHSESCVIAGRCADYILREHPLLISVYIHAPIDFRVVRTVAKEQISAKEALERCQKNDKRRSNYYNFYTDKTWGAATSYNLCVDSSVLGIDATASVILDYANRLLAIRT